MGHRTQVLLWHSVGLNILLNSFGFSSQAINERPVIPKPHIAEDFSRVLLGYCREDGDKMVIPKSDLNDALSSLTNVIMMREKNSYENYSMFYENLIRQHHQLLYQKEQVTVT